jgi:hypothetical protein
VNERLGQMAEQTQRARARVSVAAAYPEVVARQADDLDEQGQSLVQASFELEQRLHQTQAGYERGMRGVPALEPLEDGEAPDGALQLAPETGYEEREEVDVAAPEWLTGIKPESAEAREEARLAEDERREQEVNQIEAWAGGRFEDLSAAAKAGIALRLVGRNYAKAIGNISWPGWAGLAKMLLDPRASLAGVVGGLSMMLSGAANLLSAEQWAKDPLGNLLKSSADIMTGLTVVLGSITLLAAGIAAIMGAIIILSFGLASPIAGPILAFATQVVAIVGGWTIAVGKIALLLQALVLIKNLIEAATASTAEELQKESDQIRSDIGNAGQVVMQIVGAKGAQVGARGLTQRIARFERRAARIGRAGAVRLEARAVARAVRAKARAVATLPGRAVSGARRLAGLPGQAVRWLRERLTGRSRRRAAAVEDAVAGRPGAAPVRDSDIDTIAHTGAKRGPELTPAELDAELKLVEGTRPRKIVNGPYVEEVELPTGTRWRKRADGTWCRFSSPPDMCALSRAKTRLPDNLKAASGDRRILDLTGKWKETKFLSQQKGVVYILRDKATGEIMKVGKTEPGGKLLRRFEKYDVAGRKLKRDLEVEAFTVPKTAGRSVETFEKELRSTLEAQGHKLPWDNTQQRLSKPGLPRPGPGVPTSAIPSRLRKEGWQWVKEKFVKGKLPAGK